MKWRVEHTWKLVFTIALISTLMIRGPVILAQETTDQENTALSQESWEKAKQGIDYSNENKNDDEEEEEKVPEKTSSPSWNIGGSFFQIIIISLVLIALVFLIMKLIGNRSLDGKVKEQDIRTFSLEELEEDFHETDLERHLRLALEAEDYKLAVRIYYLSIIKELSNRGWIRWKKEKTNFDYIFEMRRRQSSNDFRELTLAFEIVWYGDQSISKEVYHSISPVFASYLNQIESKDE